MPKELPGFYYDAEKNRYFPYRGPIPGSSPKPPPPIPPPHPTTKEAEGLCRRFKFRSELTQARELCGDAISSHKKKFNFQAEYEKRHASQPTIWKYKGTKKMANISLEHVVADVIMPHGLMERDILLSCGANGLVCIYQVGKSQQEIDPTEIYKLARVRPLDRDLGQVPRHRELLRHLGSSIGSMTYLPSDVSCIVKLGKSSLRTDVTMSKRFVITTLGSDFYPGTVYLLDLSKPLDFNSRARIGGGYHDIADFKHTLWTADCDPEGMHAAIGTSRGVALLDIETGVSSWVLHSKSDVLSLQLDQTGNFILGGLRNGAIVTVDTRQKQIKRTGPSSSAISMPSSVCCLKSLKLWDQYFFASSMDGSIKLYDHRLTKRGSVQSYVGNVNSHTRIELEVDPSEKVVMSGGEDCYLRLWSIKSGELLFNDKLMNSIPTAVCWPGSGECEQDYWQDHHMGAWIGSYEGIFYMDWL